MNILILSSDINLPFLSSDVQITVIADSDSLFCEAKKTHPLFLLLDPVLINASKFSLQPSLFQDIPTVFMSDVFEAESFDLIHIFRPFCFIEKKVFLSAPEKILSDLSAKASQLLYSKIQRAFQQILFEYNSTSPFSFPYQETGLSDSVIHLKNILCQLSLSSIYVICICPSNFFTAAQCEIIQQMIAQNESLLLAVPYQKDYAILAKTIDKDLFSTLLQKLKIISPKAEYSIGVSRHIPVSEHMDISTAFQQAKLATEMSFYTKAEITFWSDTLFSRSLDLKTVISYEKELTNAILMGYHESELLNTLSEYINYFRTNKIIPSLVYDTVYRYLNSLDRVFKFIDPLCSIDLSLISLDAVCAEGTLSKLHATLSDMLTDFLRKGEHYEQQSDRLLVEIKAWIDDHFDQPISLSTIEQEFFVNKFVFCRQFKKFTGQTFNRYLNNIRMQNALCLLSNTDIKIYEIAHRLSFRDEGYFSSAFKKEFGISPTEYRNSKK